MDRHGHGRLAVAGIALLSVLVLTVARPSATGEPVRLLFVGDVMLGREVAPIAAGDPDGLFVDVRAKVRAADLAMANLESPLTDLPHVSGSPYALEGDPETADLLSAAGFDLVSVANNHTGDAGPAGILDTIAAVEATGMEVVGAGSDLSAAGHPVLVDHGSMQVAVLAFDATGAGLAADAGPGVAAWDPESARVAVEDVTRRADFVVVSVHGGVEYLPESDPRMTDVGDALVAWGADVVWGHGAHVVQPVTTVKGSNGRMSIVATSLGNFLFDQRGELTGEGALLEVLADEDGIIAYRLGSTSHRDLRVHFDAWEAPSGSAALIDGEWWHLVRSLEPLPDPTASVTDFASGKVVAASTGRVTSENQLETVISFRQPARPHPVRDGLTAIEWADDEGMTAHLGIYRAADLVPIWVAGMVPAPVAEVAACDGSIAMAYSTLDDTTVVGTGAAVWRSFGLDAAPTLPGPGTPACADVDADGRTDPVVLDRS
jgi:poly-gamma-glutamate capsule biosynthesis protein CapA/YwtB (metallophosphatase superfamily)